MVQRFLRDSDIWAEICVDRKRQPPEDLGKEKFNLRNRKCKISEPGRAWSSSIRNNANEGKKEGKGGEGGEEAISWGGHCNCIEYIKSFVDNYHTSPHYCVFPPTNMERLLFILVLFHVTSGNSHGFLYIGPTHFFNLFLYINVLLLQMRCLFLPTRMF